MAAWIIAGCLVFLVGWLVFKTALLAIMALVLIAWLVSRVIVYVPEGTAKKVEGPFGQRILFRWQDHGLDASGNVVERRGACYPALQWAGLVGLFGRWNRSRIVYLGKKTAFRDRRITTIPLSGMRMESPVFALTSDSKKADIRFVVRVRATNLLSVDDWAQRVRDELWARAGAVIGRCKFENIGGSRDAICQQIQRDISIPGIEILELLIPEDL